jgi:zinc D-Ala-D-Ala carboxypeptidase
MTEHFTENDFLQSRIAEERGIANIPSEDVRKALAFTAAAMERLRACLGFEVKILSGYRCYALNQAVGGSLHSQHMKGEAVDFICPEFGAPANVAAFLQHWTAILGIDQLIYEKTWVHVSFTSNPRKQVLTYRDGKYVPGIV